MKKNISRHFAALGAALFVSVISAFPVLAVTHAGHLDTVSATSISGWAWDSEVPTSAVFVEVTISGEAFGPTGSTVITVPADQYREDLQTVLGSGSHGFVYEIDWSKYNAGEYTVTASAVSGETKTPLIGTIIYKKEEAPAPSVENDSVDDSTAASTSQPTDPASAGSTSNGPASGPASASKTPTGPSYGPGKPSASKPYGPGAPAYETGEADEYLGSFHATAYCGCEKCSGGHTHTYSGTIPQANHTIAADLNLFPIGTKLLINGIVYTVEDKGSSVVDNRVDIFFETHEEALAFGLQNVDVYSVK